ncbi:MAG TPA: pyruvate kinase [Candidatus Sulfotelmatobacter sp.]|nr:pyruvate kinase [Candidatus Sulfotelmatobacter sp.]
MSRRAKIVCTLGPATQSPAAVRALVDAGMDVARLNLSHGTREEHQAVYQAVRAASDAAGRAVAVMVDLQGPKIRLGEFEGGEARLENGAEFVITTEPAIGTATRASTTYAELARDVHPGDTLLVNDGAIRLEVLASDGREVRTRVIEGGRVSDHKGLNLPGVAVSAPALTEKDREDLRFALSLRADLIALSFVRSPGDVEEVRREMAAANAPLPVIAKLEKPEAVARLEAVLEAFDGLMVARGDLGVEMPLEEVPLVQKRAVHLARERGKPVIVATQMLESMIEHARPTRAEASDVANAVLDGADALMLSGETSVGAHPLEAVSTMARIILAAESRPSHLVERRGPHAGGPQGALAAAASRLAEDVGARALVAFTHTGATARRLASHRPSTPLLAFTTEPAVRSQLALTWGVETFVVPSVSHTDEMVAQVDRAMLELGRAARGEAVVIVAGTPPGVSGTTNTIRLHRLGEV